MFQKTFIEDKKFRKTQLIKNINKNFMLNYYI